jgi:hypothetical protein
MNQIQLGELLTQDGRWDTHPRDGMGSTDQGNKCLQQSNVLKTLLI